MILALDVGNTNIVIGYLESEENIAFVERLSTDLSKTSLEYAISFKNVLEMYHVDISQIDGVILSSVVPPITQRIGQAITTATGHKAMVVGPGVKNGLHIKMDNPAQLGSDRVVCAVAGVRDYPVPLIIIDLGTATTVEVVDKDKCYIGGMILPGVNASLEALVRQTSQLSKIGLDRPRRLIGKNTSECMKSGIIYGNAACLDGLIDRIEEELGEPATVVATGGLAHVIVPHCRHSITIDDALLLKGLLLIYQKNQEA
ncbi:MAG: type III pantothenate kinase [Candidatus Fournierella pullistercoris]|uniref:Type III pantothenate kinase n=1 Tax=Candidatus Allofournierella pullistercoris TaxID=2838597 RepID=A0A948T2B4_9FIRM|nr:type III pantothenate kinase [Candidatus Fournierella pullistercoris]